MPIYEYRCKDCGAISEFLIGVNQDRAEIRCEQCASTKVEKVFSQSHISKGGVGINGSIGETCCGRTERCDVPPCSDDGVCRR